ncbi:MAG: STAS/SEC14 domain-containing protein [Bacteroidia bacterium]|nr:STAS/SEC14 domain-containing protein [Bacteroidia bacterium]MDW8158199.1 STAS/SEC14 domain-containing protein [Bacteroidia bacterium]
MPIQIQQNLENNLVEVKFYPPVVRQDIEKLKKEMQEFIKLGKPLNFMWYIQSLSDFTYRSLFSLAQLGFTHWKGFHKIAVISDEPEVDLITRWQNFFVLWQMRCFTPQEIERAKNWLLA